jgi:flagellar motor switch protein FliM
MDEQLTQENEAQAAPPETQAPAESGPYDFGEAQRLSVGQLRQLQQVHDRFAKELATSLAALTRRTIKPLAVSCSQVEHDAADRELAQCGLLIVLDALPLDVRITLGMDAALVFPLLESLLGGRAAGGSDFQRELTEIELSVLQDLHAVLTRELERAWRNAARFTLQVVEQKTDPQARKSAASPDGSLLAVVDLEVEETPGRITLLYPARIGREMQGADPSTANDAARRPEVLQQAVFERLKSSLLTMEGRLLGATMRLKDLSDLRAGDLLCLDIPLDEPIDIAVNGVSRFDGRLTDAGRKKAIRIQEILPAKPAEQWSR